MDNLPEHIERALHAHFRFHRDQHYLVDKDKVVIIDEFTCRRMPEETGRPAIHIAAAVRASLLLGRVHPHR